ncbi:MAG TPA: hypothetical protein VFF26_07465 [Gallionella sp.]|nr:hypothetical protein [Gallionella sp.]
MRPKLPPDYLAGYPAALVAQVRQLIAQDGFAGLLQRYPQAHHVGQLVHRLNCPAWSG